MNICHRIYQQLINAPPVPPETGGIIGTHERCIDTAYFDLGKQHENDGLYIPDVASLNEEIKKWQSQHIFFSGIFHTHAKQWSGLSSGDMKYITEIMKAMPLSVSRLYFPVIFPNDCIVSFVAFRSDNNVVIIEDDIKII